MIQVEICIREEEDSYYEHWCYCDSIINAIGELLDLLKKENK